MDELDEIFDPLELRFELEAVDHSEDNPFNDILKLALCRVRLTCLSVGSTERRSSCLRTWVRWSIGRFLEF